MVRGINADGKNEIKKSKIGEKHRKAFNVCTFPPLLKRGRCVCLGVLGLSEIPLAT